MNFHLTLQLSVLLVVSFDCQLRRIKQTRKEETRYSTWTRKARTGHEELSASLAKTDWSKKTRIKTWNDMLMFADICTRYIAKNLTKDHCCHVLPVVNCSQRGGKET